MMMALYKILSSKIDVEKYFQRSMISFRLVKIVLENTNFKIFCNTEL